MRVRFQQPATLHPENGETPKIPSFLKLIAYTDDPGLFVMADDPDADYPRKNRFFPTVKSWECGTAEARMY